VEANNNIIDFNQFTTKLNSIKGEVAKGNAEKDEKANIEKEHACYVRPCLRITSL